MFPHLITLVFLLKRTIKTQGIETVLSDRKVGKLTIVTRGYRHTFKGRVNDSLGFDIRLIRRFRTYNV